MTSWWLIIRLWISIQVTFAAGAWILSPFKMLDFRGYAFVLLIWLLWAYKECQRAGISLSQATRDVHKFFRRIRKPLPLTVVIIALISLVGGALWPSTYVDTLAYRLPRLLHWIDAGGWVWVPSDDTRINVVGLNLEFLWAPLVLLFKTDRPLFLLNLISYALLPGLFFSFLREVGVKPRAAWPWMWLIAGGYIYAMQAASLGGDGHSTAVALAAVTLALRARHTRDVTDVWFSTLAAAFMTGIKQVTIPLGVVWFPAIFQSARLLLRRPILSATILALSILVSFVPLAILNHVYSGTWKGFSQSELAIWETDSPVWGVVGGVFGVVVHNLVPPIFPWAMKWNELMGRFAITDFGRHFKYDLGPALLQQGVGEHTASLGCGIVFLAAATWLAARKYRRPAGPQPRDPLRTALLLLPYPAALLFLAKSAVSFNARYIAPYYPFFLPSVLSGAGVSPVVRQRWWQRCALLLNLTTILLLLLSRQRPMWPVFTVTQWLSEHRPESVRLQRICRAYSLIHQTRRFVFPKIQALIPPEEHMVGYAVGWQPYLELPLWMPLGARSVVRLNAADDFQSARSKGIRYILLDPSALMDRNGLPIISLDQWLKRYQARVIARFDANLVHQANEWTAYWVEIISTAPR